MYTARRADAATPTFAALVALSALLPLLSRFAVRSVLHEENQVRDSGRESAAAARFGFEIESPFDYNEMMVEEKLSIHQRLGYISTTRTHVQNKLVSCTPEVESAKSPTLMQK